MTITATTFNTNEHLQSPDWLDPIRGRVHAITPGEWTTQAATLNGRVLTHCIGINGLKADEDCIAETDPRPDGRAAANADFIAHAPADIRKLLGHIDQLTRRLAAAEAAFPGITRLTPGVTAELTIYRVEHDSIPCGLFTNRPAARACGSDLNGRDDGRTDVAYAWIPEHSELAAEPPAEDLSAFGPGQDDETITNYSIVPLTLHATYDPETWKDEA
ncbi:hypothetical protein [Streptomyces sp. NPDC029554]|uniref:hypothetical protein n=1 Tax=Streptomyces sp. NPDC029554 TaxID=3155126 RepID=UPI00340D077F